MLMIMMQMLVAYNSTNNCGCMMSSALLADGDGVDYYLE